MCSQIHILQWKIEKDSDNFWYSKLTLIVGRLGDFALFDTSPLVQFSKFKNFPWVCWFLGKNLSNFIYPVWKLHNPYWQYNLGIPTTRLAQKCPKSLLINPFLTNRNFLLQVVAPILDWGIKPRLHQNLLENWDG